MTRHMTEADLRELSPEALEQFNRRLHPPDPTHMMDALAYMMEALHFPRRTPTPEWVIREIPLSLSPEAKERWKRLTEEASKQREAGPTRSDPLCQRFDPIILVLAKSLHAAWVDLRERGRVYRRDSMTTGTMTVSEPEDWPMKLAAFRIVTWDQGDRALQGLRVREVIDLHGAPARLVAIANEYLRRTEAAQQTGD